MSGTLLDRERTREESAPLVGVGVSVPPWKQYCWVLLAESLLRLDYPKERMRLLILVDGPADYFQDDVMHFQDRYGDRFLSVGVERSDDVERRLRRRDAITAFCPRGCEGQTHGTRLRQRMLEYYLFEAEPRVEYVFFLDSDALWPAYSLRRLVALSQERQAPSVGVLPFRHPGKHLILFWFPDPPTGRLVPYNPPDIGQRPFCVDFATLGGTVLPVPILEEFQARGGWYPYPVSGYPDGPVALGDDVYLFLGSGQRIPPWVCPDVSGWHVENTGWAQRFRWSPETGEGEIIERQLDLRSYDALEFEEVRYAAPEVPA